ncbi:uncharacterized protein LOC119568236 isoform X1 [Penaeus monodon]|uniref:uncharacterized protein LOC119568236 isoform X1 n=1 Tax=Penaeus monodon TaxID=6687 RepID=UPI0018A702AE|nr:uncharacterized protein LOC119568236 isoform X1 [Penaeus monodon]
MQETRRRKTGVLRRRCWRLRRPRQHELRATALPWLPHGPPATPGKDLSRRSRRNGEDQHMVTPGLARHKRERSVSTPVTTPVSVDTQNPSVSSAGVREPRSFICKKSLTFPCDSWQPHRDEPVNRGSPEVDILPSPDATAVRRRTPMELPDIASADPGGPLLPTKRFRLGLDFDPDIIQELLPLPTHCSARLSMTPLSALKSSSAPPDEADSMDRSQTCAAATMKAEKAPRHKASTQNPMSFRDKVDGMAFVPSSDSVRHEAQGACRSRRPLNDVDIQARRNGRQSGEPDTNKSVKESERILTQDSLRVGSHDSHMRIPKGGTESVDSQQQYSFFIDQLGPFSCMRKTPSSQMYNTNSSSVENQHNAGSVVSSISFQDKLLGMLGAGEAPLESKKANLVSLDSNRKHSPTNLRPTTPTSVPSSRYQDVQTETLLNILPPAAGPSESQAVTPKGKLIRPFSRESRSTISQAVTPEGKLAEVFSPVPNSPGCLGYIPKQKPMTPVLPGPSGCQVCNPKGILAQFMSPVPSSSYQDVTPKRLSVQTSSSEPGPSRNPLVSEAKEASVKKISPLCGSDYKAVTPDANFIMVHIQAPRKLSFRESRRRTPTCKRSLAREFAEMDTGKLFITPPQSPVRPDYCLPEMESDSDE